MRWITSPLSISSIFCGAWWNFPFLLPSDLHTVVVHYQIKLNGHATVVGQSLPKMYQHVVDRLDRLDTYPNIHSFVATSFQWKPWWKTAKTWKRPWKKPWDPGYPRVLSGRKLRGFCCWDAWLGSWPGLRAAEFPWELHGNSKTSMRVSIHGTQNGWFIREDPMFFFHI